MNGFLNSLNGYIWGLPMIVLIMGVGIFLTLGLKGIQIRKLPIALKFMFSSEEDGEGDISSFGALCTALSATIGTGNIVGVATAIVAGGPGALFWMELAALLGMATKYAEGLLAVKFRTVDDDGKILGGPFYYIERGMGLKWKWLAKLFAFFGLGAGLLGIGTFTQINGITSAAQTFFDPNKQNTVHLFGNDYSIAVIIVGLIVTIAVAAVLLGGVQRISQVAEIIVPAMIVLYVSLCLFMIVLNLDKIPGAFREIFAGAFGLRAVSGGALGAMMVAMQKGIARGIFSNESGLGSAPIAAAAAKTKEPARQGLVSMTGTFIDTIVVCTMTGLAIIITGAWDVGLEGAAVTIYAFSAALPFSETICSFLLMICLSFFAFTTIMGWNYYAERCLSYLTNGSVRGNKIFRFLYIAAVFIGPYMTVAAVWTLADIFNGLMAFPNLIALIALSPVVFKETKEYLARLTKEKETNKNSANEVAPIVEESEF
ncbi:AGCS family alanine or glycine:cation symporter [Enterococcus sp. PF1-24]|uniref:alanine/glycine:cation symporter family protein n=1 Tax=unclassified Enterococcus TaxID=2608891 RepID=UPI002474E4B8|nr:MULTISPECIES: sodium:alanine symporter family protein [unclassified Enterococcus]MDH6364141.1 AGCS family alanine or glycine:cation symporter [Enterococcus sp. PFB1-1]MDH6401242.1 AGCS family alanine or glycine:cation symporter [Enterococcus sp. PF1-24]